MKVTLARDKAQKRIKKWNKKSISFANYFFNPRNGRRWQEAFWGGFPLVPLMCKAVIFAPPTSLLTNSYTRSLGVLDS